MIDVSKSSKMFLASNVFNPIIHPIIHFQKEFMGKGDQARVLQSVILRVE